MSSPAAGEDQRSASAAANPGAELAGLLGQASTALDLQCRAAHFELRQTQRLLSDATRRLLDCFHAAARELAEPGSGTPAARAGANLLAASQHLQFSDLVAQLLNSTEERVDGLLHVSERLQELLRALSAPGPNAGEQLAFEKRAFLDALAELEGCGSTRVHQSDMTAGETELF
jgi:hypothetical protein